MVAEEPKRNRRSGMCVSLAGVGAAGDGRYLFFWDSDFPGNTSASSTSRASALATVGSVPTSRPAVVRDFAGAGARSLVTQRWVTAARSLLDTAGTEDNSNLRALTGSASGEQPGASHIGQGGADRRSGTANPGRQSRLLAAIGPGATCRKFPWA